MTDIYKNEKYSIKKVLIKSQPKYYLNTASGRPLAKFTAKDEAIHIADALLKPSQCRA